MPLGEIERRPRRHAHLGPLLAQEFPEPLQLRLLVDDAFDTVGYRTGFAPAGSDWQTLRLPLAGFRASARGREVPGAPPLEPAHIRQLGLMIKGKRAGPFALDLRRISLA
jgi:hypothetical protein